ncbi:hypothetical protein AWZ03_008651 [Drosophila navojoa]|uniref:Uncharacterized protein n=1 Tax=Drosophila navojoa TaxID=7232 RepID=A0A484BA64_DRONA|nr:uncharacterized protein LOC115563277 [Drosophila navojoa]TDG44920.1 hypothetical protein AWZ03_008651 [Drosophila navojoa]
MADVHEGIVAFILLLCQLIVYVRAINPIKREALLLVVHNIFMYYVINRFKHLAQASINFSGPVNTFYYVPFVYEEPANCIAHEDMHLVLKSTTWQFLETLFRHHLALLLPFLLALLVPRCKLIYVSSLVILSNLALCLCFMYSMWKWLILSGLSQGLYLLPIFFLGPVVQLLLLFRFTAHMLLNLWIVV